MPMKFYADKIKVHSLLMAVFAITTGILLLMSCMKSTTPAPPVPVWEDNGADSTTLKIAVQTAQGLVLVGQYVSLALSRDSLSANNLVRKTPTNGLGVAVFSKMYPRVIYYNCIAVTFGNTYFGSGWLRLSAGVKKDTILIVH